MLRSEFKKILGLFLGVSKYMMPTDLCYALYMGEKKQSQMGCYFSLLLFTRSIVSICDPMNTRLPCPSLFPEVCANSCPLSW